MDARGYWNTYVDGCGGMVEVSARLQTPYSTIASICAGHRGIGRTLAQRFAKADPLLDASRLLWVRPTRRKTTKRAKRKTA